MLLNAYTEVSPARVTDHENRVGLRKKYKPLLPSKKTGSSYALHMHQFYTINEVAGFLDISAHEVRSLVRNGDIQETSIGADSRIKDVDLIKYIDDRPNLSKARHSAISVAVAILITPLSAAISLIGDFGWWWMLAVIGVGVALAALAATPTNGLLDQKNLLVRPSKVVRDDAGRKALTLLGGGLVGVGAPSLLAAIFDTGGALVQILAVAVPAVAAIALIFLIRRK